MPPLDTLPGQRYVDALIAHLGGVDLAIFDNIQALTISEDDFGAGSWQRVLPWAKDLTRRVIGQIWAHHTGNDESHGYGSKTREWQLDTVMLMERVEQPDADIAFHIRFTKARERAPDNRQDFDNAIVRLAADAWESERGGHITKWTGKDRALELLVDAVAREGTIPPACEHIPPRPPCVTDDLWRRYVEAGTITDQLKPNSFRRTFQRDAARLIEAGQVGRRKPWVWIIR
jgi:hypothetical protein